MRSHKGNEKGMTLVEILAALVILGIVFIGFMTIFPQMTNFNEKTYTKLDTMNLAKVKLEEIKGSGIPLECDNILDEYCTVTDLGEEEYDVYLTYKTSPDLGTDLPAEGQVSLFQVHVKYYKKGQSRENNPLSETFGYVEVSG